MFQNKASQSELRELRGHLNAARAEVTVAQGDLVAARTEETRRRELKAAESKKDATLGECAAPVVWLADGSGERGATQCERGQTQQVVA